MAIVSSRSKAIARAGAAAFGGPPTVTRYWDGNHQSHVDIVACRDSPCRGVVSYATVGVSHTPLAKDGRDIGARVELVGACEEGAENFGGYLATAAFGVINSGWLAAPGIIFPDIIGMNEGAGTMRHILFLPPFLWEDRLKTLEFQGERIAWLLAVPISEGEMRFAQMNGVPALEDLFEEQQIDVFNARRPSVVE